MKNILLINDYFNVKKSLTKNIFSFTEHNGVSVGLLKALKNTPPDLIFICIDKKIPVQLEKTKVKQEVKKRNIPVIICSHNKEILVGLMFEDFAPDLTLSLPIDDRLLLILTTYLLDIKHKLPISDTNLIVQYKGSHSIKIKDKIFLDNINKQINQNLLDKHFNVDDLSQRMGLSRNHLYRKVKQLTGKSAVEYILLVRLNNAIELINDKSYSLKEICFKTGFSDQAYFSKCFKKHFTVTPSEYLKNL
ncbi:AraC family transcriptional regulator [Bacteroidales bacterium]|nr:AraC family transcriptional regulator [Bacteroidales bacterium]